MSDIYDEVQENRTKHKYSHGGFVKGVERYFENKGYNSKGSEQRPNKPNVKNLSEGGVHDLLLTKSNNYVGVEIDLHINPDLYRATKLVEKFNDTGVKKKIVVCVQRPTIGCLEYYKENKVECYSVSKISKLGHLSLKRLV